MLSCTESVVGAASGYQHLQYCKSLSQVGRPRALSRCAGWILEREIPRAPFRDAMGCYPLFACRHWSRLKDDLAAIAEELVCVSIVTDPFGDYDEALLQECFPDKLIHFKQHLCIDLHFPMAEYVCRHHQRNVVKALACLEVERCWDPPQLLDDWTRLYSHLIQHRGIHGIAAFSRAAFATQLAVPGLVAFQARYRDVPVGMLLWYIQNNVAYYHLGAHNETGYRLGSSFALFWRSLEHFNACGPRWIDLGAGASSTSRKAA